MKYYPVLIPTVNRYQHLRRCVDSLRMNTHADKTELVIILDYPANEKYVEGWKRIKEYLPTITGFRAVTIIEREENYYFSGKHYSDIREKCWINMVLLL